jgi:hypothetical protein
VSMVLKDSVGVKWCNVEDRGDSRDGDILSLQRTRIMS